jgi:hypothetical protein
MMFSKTTFSSGVQRRHFIIKLCTLSSSARTAARVLTMVERMLASFNPSPIIFNDDCTPSRNFFLAPSSRSSYHLRICACSSGLRQCCRECCPCQRRLPLKEHLPRSSRHPSGQPNARSTDDGTSVRGEPSQMKISHHHSRTRIARMPRPTRRAGQIHFHFARNP